MKISQFSKKVIEKRKQLPQIIFNRIKIALSNPGKYHLDWLEMSSHYCDGFRGKKILEIGSAEGMLLKQLSKRFEPAEAIGLDLVANNREITKTCRVEQGDIREASYPDGYFDVIISLSAFEHVFNFDIALQEMHRILKPGGYLFSQFGPIWSAPHGHHLFFNNLGVTYSYYNVILPPFCHLLMEPKETLAILAQRYTFDTEINEGIVDYVYNSPEQNQLFFENYLNLINESKFTVLLFKGNSSEKLNKIYQHNIAPEIFEKLKNKYPNYNNFMHNGIVTLLKK